MEPQTRGRGKRGAERSPPGTFRPSLPTDSQEVVRLFAIASRAVCALPTALDAVSTCLQRITEALVAPEKHAAEECSRLWHLFARVAQLPKATLRLEAARALCRDLDALGQRLDLPPLAEWIELPDGIDEPEHDALMQHGPQPVAGLQPEPLSLEMVQKSARALQSSAKDGHGISAEEGERLLAALEPQQRQSLFQQMVGQGVLGRSDVNLLIRFLLKGDKIGPSDTMLREVLERMAAYLAK